MLGLSSKEFCCNKPPNGIEFTVSAPGKVILHGEHSVVYGKLAIAGSLELRTRIHLVEIDTPDKFHFKIPSLGLEYVFSIQVLEKYLLEKSPVLNVDISTYNWECPNLIDYNVQITSINQALHSIFKSITNGHNNPGVNALKVLFYFLSGIISSTNVKLNPLCIYVETDLEMGAGTGSSASFCVACLDNTICTYGNIVKFRKNEKPTVLKLSNTLFDVLLINTRVSRETSKLVAHVANRREIFPALVNHILEAMEDLTNRAADTITKIDNCSSANRLNYLHDLETLVQMNHGLLCALGVSHQKLEEVVMVLEKHGIKGKLTGAGGGGFAIALLPAGYDAGEVIQKLKELDFGVICTRLGGDGVKVE
ncbi:mevalonate kinase isoform X2 [Rhynchophorus ferrugineus]|uniref:mevalonate kinase isoform X2 n=1 Tax=Rhynchophorus ferrugineus TaxID=354439 RepID=UPI003FCE89A2